MEAVVGVLALLLMLTAFACGFFLAFVQPIWGIVDVAVSPRLSGGAKATLIILTLVLLGPLLTFFYACFGTTSAGLRRTTIVMAIVGIVSGIGVLGLAAVQSASMNEIRDMAEAAEGAPPPRLTPVGSFEDAEPPPEAPGPRPGPGAEAETAAVTE